MSDQKSNETTKQVLSTESKEEKKCVNWLPLESNPAILNKFVHGTGLSEEWNFCDVFGLDDELLAMVPTPCTAVILLFPSSSPEFKQAKQKQKEKIDKDGQKLDKNIFYITQHDGSGNACGSIACLHAVANSDGVEMKDGALKKFLQNNKDKSPDDKGNSLLEAYDLFETSESSANSSEAQTAAPEDREQAVGHHFICFASVGGDLYELDGRKAYPINHGATKPESFLKDTATVIKKNFFAVLPGQADGFSLMAFAKGTSAF